VTELLLRFAAPLQNIVDASKIWQAHDSLRHPGDPRPRLQYVFQTPGAAFSVALTYRPHDAQVTALIVGLRKPGIEEVWARLRAMKKHIWAPMLLPSVLVQSRRNWIKRRLCFCHEVIGTVRSKTGLDARDARTKDNNIRDIPPLAVDNVEISKDLTFVREKLAKIDHECDSLIDLLTSLDRAGQDCLDETPKAYIIKAREDNALLREMNADTASLTRSSKGYTNFLSRRASAYVQTV